MTNPKRPDFLKSLTPCPICGQQWSGWHQCSMGGKKQFTTALSEDYVKDLESKISKVKAQLDGAVKCLEKLSILETFKESDYLEWVQKLSNETLKRIRE